jgi:hypothetical protein
MSLLSAQRVNWKARVLAARGSMENIPSDSFDERELPLERL